MVAKGILVCGAKFHYIPVSLYEGIRGDLVTRFGETLLEEDRAYAWIDLPGMIMADRTFETFDLEEGFQLKIPHTDVEYFYDLALKTPTRVTAGGKVYHKLHGYNCCVALTGEQLITFLSAVEKNSVRLQEQKAQQKQEFANRINNINKGGIKVVSSEMVKGQQKRMKELESPDKFSFKAAPEAGDEAKN